MPTTREEVLTLLGIIASFAGVLTLFWQGYVAVGILVIIVGVLLVWHYIVLDQPEFTLLEVNKTIFLNDARGHSATLIRQHKARANHKGITEFWIKGISSDGVIGKILIDDKPPDYQGVDCGDVVVCKRFKRPLQRGQEDELTLSYDIEDGFLRDSETFIHSVAHKTKHLRMAVRCPSDRPIRSARASLRYGGHMHKALPNLKISENGCKAELIVRKPKLGEQYYLEWDW